MFVSLCVYKQPVKKNEYTCRKKISRICLENLQKLKIKLSNEDS